MAYQRGEVGKIIPVTTSNTYTHNWANANTDWYDVFFKDHAMSQEHSLSLSGGTERFSYYLPEDFSVMVMDLSDSLLIVRVDLPVRDMGVPSCFRVYFAWNDETQEGRYFTIERTQDPGKHLLGEFKKDWKHVDYGEAPAEGAELQRVLDIIRQPGEN